MTLAVVRNLGSPSGFRCEQDVDDFEQEMVDQYALAMAAAGLTDGHIAAARAGVVEFVQSLPGRLWTAMVEDSDRFLVDLRRRGFRWVRRGSRRPKPTWSSKPSRTGRPSHRVRRRT